MARDDGGQGANEKRIEDSRQKEQATAKYRCKGLLHSMPPLTLMEFAQRRQMQEPTVRHSPVLTNPSMSPTVNGRTERRKILDRFRLHEKELPRRTGALRLKIRPDSYIHMYVSMPVPGLCV